MKRKNLTARKKAKKKELLFKDPKILNFYKNFKLAVFKNIRKKSFALAVSGGPDSLCLAYFAKIYALEFGKFNIRVNACIGGKIRGQENEVRVFDIKHIKGLEFEAVFFIDVQNLYETQPELFDKYLYVGTTRSANYLGITTSSEQLPKKFEKLTKLFNENWK